MIVWLAGVNEQFGWAAGLTLTVALQVTGVEPAIPLTVKLYVVVSVGDTLNVQA